MKRFSIARYKLGEEEYVAMPKEIVQKLVDDDPCLYWYEDVDEYYRNRQKQRKNPAIKISFVYNYKRPPQLPDIHATFADGTDDILVRVNNPTEQCISKLKEIANKLEANLYK